MFDEVVQFPERMPTRRAVDLVLAVLMKNGNIRAELCFILW